MEWLTGAFISSSRKFHKMKLYKKKIEGNDLV